MVLALTLTLLLRATPELAEGRVAFSALKYRRAIEVLKPVTGDVTATLPERLEALELTARAYLALGRGEQAHTAWTALLSLDPMAPEPAGAPKVRASFQQAKQAKFSPTFVQMTRVPSAADVLEFEVVNPWRLALTAELWEATGDDFERRSLTLAAGRVVTPLRAGSRNYVWLVGSDGVLRASLGSATEPLLGPPALVATDAPRLERPPVLVPVPPSSQSPGLAPTSGTLPDARRIGSVVVAALGVAGMVVGAVLLANGTANQALADGYPFNELDSEQAGAAGRQARDQFIAGGVTGGVGVVGLVAGGALFFTSFSNADPGH